MQLAALMCDELKSSRLRTSINKTLEVESRRSRYSPADVIPPDGAVLSIYIDNQQQ